jgi:5-methylcytosine-specific restriction endonuclease McrA
MRDDTIHEARSLHARLVDLLRAEFSSLADFLEALAEFDRRRHFRDLGHADLFSYLHQGLKLSRAAAHHRRAAAWLVGRFPAVLEPIREGKLSFTTAAVLASVATEENLAAVLPRFYGLSKQEALELAAELKPRTVVPTRTVVTRVESSRPVKAVEEVKMTVPEIRPGERGMPRAEVERMLVEPMTDVASRIHITVSRDFLALLKKAKAGESHRNPGATDEQILTAALEALIEKQGKRKASVPAKVKREVVKRDQGKCQWKLADGGRCGATARLEVDHVQPRGKGGPSTVENCRVLCRPHNLEAAREAYGDAHMDLFVAREEVASYGSVQNPIVHAPAAAVGWRPCSGRKPPRSGSSACASRSCSSSAPGSSSSTTRARPWACRSAGGRRTTSGRCTSAPWPRRPTWRAG